MEYFTAAEQQEMCDKLRTRLKKENIEKEIVGFNYWFNEVRLIDPTSLNHEQAQGFVDRLLNTDEGKLYFVLFEGKFYHFWYKAMQVPFLALTQHEIYHRDIKTTWYFSWRFSSDRYIVRDRVF